MALVWTILNCLKKTLSVLIRELRELFRLILAYQQTTKTNKKRLIARAVGIKLIEYLIITLCSYLGISKAAIPLIQIIITILFGG